MAMNAEQLANARIIISVGKQVGASQRDILIGLMTALQESGLRNLKYGDRDSQGLFQQRPSMGWGTIEQVTDPYYSARTFFEGKPGNPGLFSVKDRDSLSLTQAAQRVQRSGFPDAYAKHEAAARRLLGLSPAKAKVVAAPTTARPGAAKVPGAPEPDPIKVRPTRSVSPAKAAATPVGLVPGGPAGIGAPAGLAPEAPVGLGGIYDTPGMELPVVDQATFTSQYLEPKTTGYAPTGGLTDKRGADIVGALTSFIGVPYVWAGTGREGVDCSGLLQTVYKQFGINLPRVSSDQARAGRRIPMSEMRPGDLVAWDNSSRNDGADHIGAYVGDGYIIEAPRPGLNVRRRRLDDGDSGGWGVRLQRGS